MRSSRKVGERDVFAGQPGPVIGEMSDVVEVPAQTAHGVTDARHVGSAAALCQRQEAADQLFGQDRLAHFRVELAVEPAYETAGLCALEGIAGDERKAGGFRLLEKFADGLDPADGRIGVFEKHGKGARRVQFENVGSGVPGLLIDQVHVQAIFGERKAQAAAEGIEREVDERRHVKKKLTLTLATRMSAAGPAAIALGTARIKRVRPQRQVNPTDLAEARSSQPMLILQIVVLALIQGITEFLPISSSGHLLLVPALTGWPDQGIVTDVMVHMGSFLAVVVYFWRDCVNLTAGGIDLLRGRVTAWGRLALLIVLGTIPAVLFGVFLDKIGFMDLVRQMPVIVAWNAIVFGILLYLCDRYGMSRRRMSDMTWLPALIIGVAQAVAIIPGVSRSGITMTAARALGFERPEAARFAFLLGIPAIAGAGILKLGDAVASGSGITFPMVLTAVLTFFVALGTITVLMRLVRHVSFLPFAIYRVALGLVLLGLLYSGMPLGAVN